MHNFRKTENGFNKTQYILTEGKHLTPKDLVKKMLEIGQPTTARFIYTVRGKYKTKKAVNDFSSISKEDFIALKQVVGANLLRTGKRMVEIATVLERCQDANKIVLNDMNDYLQSTDALKAEVFNLKEALINRCRTLLEEQLNELKNM